MTKSHDQKCQLTCYLASFCLSSCVNSHQIHPMHLFSCGPRLADSAKYSEGQHGNFSLVDVKCGSFHILMFHTLKYCYSVSVNAFVVLRGAGVSTTCWKSYSLERNADRPRNPSTAQINQSFPHSSSRPINICQGLNRLALSIQYVT